MISTEREEETMANTLDPQASQAGLYAMFKGASGVGKSVGAMSFPNPYVFDFDRKMPNIALKHFPGKSIEYDTFTDAFVFADKIAGWLEEKNCPFETIIFDSITSMVNLIITSIAEKKGESLIKLLQRIQKTSGGGSQVEMLGIDYYNAETRFVTWLMDATKTLYARPGNPKNIIFIAHVIVAESAPDLKTKVVTKTRSIVTAGRKVAAYIPTQFDDVYMFGYSEVGGGEVQADGRRSEGKTEYHILTQPSGEDDAKCSFRLRKSTDFTNANLYELLSAQIKGQRLTQGLNQTTQNPQPTNPLLKK